MSKMFPLNPDLKDSFDYWCISLKKRGYLVEKLDQQMKWRDVYLACTLGWILATRPIIRVGGRLCECVSAGKVSSRTQLSHRGGTRPLRLLPLGFPPSQFNLFVVHRPTCLHYRCDQTHNFVQLKKLTTMKREIKDFSINLLLYKILCQDVKVYQIQTL